MLKATIITAAKSTVSKRNDFVFWVIVTTSLQKDRRVTPTVLLQYI